MITENYLLHRRLQDAEAKVVELEKRIKASEGRSASDARHIEYILSHLDMRNVTENFITDLSTSLVSVIGAPVCPVTYVIGGEDTKDTDRADYVCDGVADEEEFEAAINALPNGWVVMYKAAAGGASTITFPATAPAFRGFYNGDTINIYYGKGSGQSRVIKSYSAARVATVSSAWSVVPDATSYFEIVRRRGTIAVLEGIYTFSSPLLVPSGVNIVGCGPGTIFKPDDDYDHYTSWLIGMYDSANSTGHGHVKLSDFSLHGNKGLFGGGHDSLLSNIIIKDLTDSGVGVYVGEPGVGSGDRATLHNVQAYGTYDTTGGAPTGFAIWNADSVQMISCTAAGLGYGGDIYKGTGNLVIGCNFFQNWYCGLLLEGQSYNPLITGNVFRDNGLAGSPLEGDLELLDNVDNAALLSNIFRRSDAGFGDYGIYIYSNTCNGTLISNNDLLGSGDDSAIRDDGTGTVFGAGNRVKSGAWTTAQDYTP